MYCKIIMPLNKIDVRALSQTGKLLPEVELKGCVGKLLKVSQGLHLLPHFNYVLQQSPVFLLLTVSQVPSVPVIFSRKNKFKKLRNRRREQEN